MECERLQKLVKNWYVQVQGEAMAPARMVDFMRNHVDGCLTCMADPIVAIEVKRITEIVLPPAKIPKAVRKENDLADDEDDGVADVVDSDEEEETDDLENDDDDDEDDLDELDDDDEI